MTVAFIRTGSAAAPPEHAAAREIASDEVLFKGSTVVVILYSFSVESSYRYGLPSTLRFRQASCRSGRDRGGPSFRWANAVCWSAAL